MNIELIETVFYGDFSGYTAKIDGLNAVIVISEQEFFVFDYTGSYTNEEIKNDFYLHEMMGHFWDFFDQEKDKSQFIELDLKTAEKEQIIQFVEQFFVMALNIQKYLPKLDYLPEGGVFIYYRRPLNKLFYAAKHVQYKTKKTPSPYDVLISSTLNPLAKSKLIDKILSI